MSINKADDYDTQIRRVSDNGVFENPSIDNTSLDPNDGVKRGLKTRHLSMMALAGIIGPGLLVGAGGALNTGGPLALLLGFGIIGLLAFSVSQSLGEVTTVYPTGGAFMTLAERFVDKAFSCAVGWVYFIIWVTVLANEYNMVSSILTFWTDKVPIWGWFLIFWVFFTGFQLLGVQAFGEAEYWLAFLKIGGLCAYFIFSIVYVSGGIKGRPAFGFHYWHDPGSLADGFRGIASVFVYCSTFYAGVESVAVAASETQNPRKAVPTAINQVFYRIIFVYMGSALFFGMTVPWNSPGLLAKSSKVLRSPMAIAIQNAGWYGGANLVNAFILVTCLSAINSSIYIGSRTVLFMAKDRTAPRFLGYLDKRGVPVAAIIFTNLFGVISVMNVTQGAATAFGYIVNISGVATFLVWGSISIIHLRFRAAWKRSGLTPDDLPFKSKFYPINPWFGLFFNFFLALIQGWTTLSPFDAGDFVDAYILLPFFAVLYLGYKFWFKTKFVRIDEIDVNEGRRFDLDYSKDEEVGVEGAVYDDNNIPKQPWYKKAWELL